MMSIFIMLVVAIAITAGIGFGVLSLIKTGETSLSVQRNQLQVDAVAASVRSRLQHEAGNVLIPVRVDGGSPIALAPAFAPFAATPHGKPLIYCPVGSVPATGGTWLVDRSGNQTYEVDIVVRDGMSFVSAGAPGDGRPEGDALRTATDTLRDMGAAAFIISPAPNVETDPSCLDVEAVDNGAGNTVFIHPLGSVMPIFTTSAEGVVQNLAVGFTGALPEDLPRNVKRFSTIGDAAGYLAAEELQHVAIHLAPEVWASSDDLRSLAANDGFRTVKFQGRDTGTTLWVVDPTASSYLDIAFDGLTQFSDIILRGTATDGGTTASFDVRMEAPVGAQMRLSDTTAGGIAVRQGTVLIEGTSVIAPESSSVSEPTIMVEGGRVVLEGTVDIASDSVTAIKVEGGLIEIDGTPDLFIDTPTIPVSVSGGGAVTAVNPAAGFAVTRGGVADGAWLAGPEQVSETCAIGDDQCEVSCPAGKAAATGSCNSGADLQPLAGYGTRNDAGTSVFWCQWSSASISDAPSVSAVCQ